MTTLSTLSTPSVWQFMKRALWNWVEITLILTLVVMFDEWWVKVLCAIALGTRQHALALLAHEALHKNVSNRLWLNNLLGNVFTALPLYQSLNFFKRFHLDHHTHMMSEKDPEIHVRRASPHIWSLPITKRKRLFILMRDLCGWGYLDTRFALPHILPHLTFLDVILPLAWWCGAVIILRQFDLGWLAWFWMASFVTSYWAMFRQRALTEHIGTIDTHKLHANMIQRFFYLPHYTWLHYEHHLKANVPCWNLKAFRKLNQTTSIKTVSQLFSEMSQS